jgi:hypothetical protein
LGRQLLAYSGSTEHEVRAHAMPESSSLRSYQHAHTSTLPDVPITNDSRMCSGTPMHPCAHPRSTTSLTTLGQPSCSSRQHPTAAPHGSTPRQHPTAAPHTLLIGSSGSHP